MIDATAISLVPMEGESASSLVLRAATVVSPFPGLVVESLFGDAEAIASAVHRHDVANDIASSFGLEETALREMMVLHSENGLKIGPFTVRPRDIDQARRRVCPEVLRADRVAGIPAHQRLSWAIAPLRHDPETGEQIVDRCGCGRELLWSQTIQIDECPGCGSLLWETTIGKRPPQDLEAVQFLAELFSSSEAQRQRFRLLLPTRIAQWTEGDLLELFETIGLFSQLEVLIRLPREDSEIWTRAVGIRAALEGMDGLRSLIGHAFDDPPTQADRLWSARRIGFANLAINRCPSAPVRALLSDLLRSYI
ncbi:hypothetical protein [Bradyrhizobium genosp. A]|uniref:hypothetical protein n=1 Tax=Bradyrhizobium genosp. A TaxID=83626 RepID=UPI003CEA5687